MLNVLTETQRMGSMSSHFCRLSELLSILEDAEVIMPASLSDAAYIDTIGIDSRSRPSLFIALPGSKTDGHAFAEQAAANSVAVLVARQSVHQKIRNIPEQHNCAVIVVDSPMQALQKIAMWNRKRCDNVCLIAVTGSNGKTTTKHLLGKMLEEHTHCYVSPGNYNSDLGVALAMTELRPDYQYAVFEAGIDRVGEMDVIEEILLPNISLLTNIGHAHIGSIGTQGDIIQEKKKLFRHSSLAVLPAFDEAFSELSAGLDGEVLPYGSADELESIDSRGLDGSYIHFADKEFHLPLLGEHNARNALAALAVARKLSIPEVHIQSGMESMEMISGRGKISYGALTIIGDWYNSNPESLYASVQLLKNVAESLHATRCIAILGGIKELGEYSLKLHQELYELLCKEEVEHLFLYGEEFSTITLQKEGHQFFDVWDELLSAVRSVVRKHDCILIKGSRYYQLERLQELLQEEGGSYVA